MVLGPLGGVLADRYDRRRLLIASALLRALLMVALAAVATFGLPILLVLVIPAAAAASGVVEAPCVPACTARFVADAELQRANALRSAIGQAAILAGPPLGALVLVAATPAVAILLNALTFLASAAAIRAIAAGSGLPSRRALRRATAARDSRQRRRRARTAGGSRRDQAGRRRHRLQRRLRATDGDPGARGPQDRSAGSSSARWWRGRSRRCSD